MSEQRDLDMLAALASKYGYEVKKKSDNKVGGRPPSINKKKAKLILQSIGEGNTIGRACNQVGVSYQALRRYRRKHPDFDAELRDVKQVQIDVLEDSLFVAAQAGNVTAGMFLLVNRTKHLPVEDPQKYQNTNKVIHTMESEKPPPQFQEITASADDTALLANVAGILIEAEEKAVDLEDVEEAVILSETDDVKFNPRPPAPDPEDQDDSLYEYWEPEGEDG